MAGATAPSAHIIGAGIAGLTATHLLRALGWHVALSGTLRPSPGAILLRETTARLLLAIWDDTSGTILRGTRRLKGRRVLWGSTSEARVMQPGYVIPLTVLAAALVERLGTVPTAPLSNAWTLAAADIATDTLGPSRRYGTREAWIAEVALSRFAPLDEAVLESAEGIWFMLLPTAPGRGTLQAVTARPNERPPFADLRARSRLIHNLVAGIRSQAGPFPCMPRLRVPAARQPIIAIGEAALACDPLCGDGVGHALRGAVAAVSALRAIATEGSADAPFVVDVLNRYDAGLAFAMRRHLEACIGHYRTAGAGWEDEIAAMRAV